MLFINVYKYFLMTFLCSYTMEGIGNVEAYTRNTTCTICVKFIAVRGVFELAVDNIYISCTNTDIIYYYIQNLN